VKKEPTLRERQKEELESTKVIFLSNALIVVKLAIFLPNVLMQGVQIVMNKKFLRKKRNIRKEIRK